MGSVQRDGTLLRKEIAVFEENMVDCNELRKKCADAESNYQACVEMQNRLAKLEAAKCEALELASKQAWSENAESQQSFDVLESETRTVRDDLTAQVAVARSQVDQLREQMLAQVARKGVLALRDAQGRENLQRDRIAKLEQELDQARRALAAKPQNEPKSSTSWANWTD